MIVAVLQARVSSRRLPGKVLLPILGRPMLSLQIERVLRSQRIDKLVLATSDQPEDDGMVDIAQSVGIDLFRGSLEDVLDRFYGAAAAANPDWVVRLTGDCPLADAEVIDRVIDAAVERSYDYATNAVHPTWPDGLDCEVMTFAALEQCWREAQTPVEREHVTPYINTNPEKFRLFHVKGETDLSGLRWTVDEPADFDFVTRVYEALYPSKRDFTSADVLAFLADNPEVMAVNANIERNEGYRLSLEKLRNSLGKA
ncbi:cytidylyltransferase domain-containing protein [Devosia salina]|uniref:Glycosyltransferase family protein n=1 Tax=Devosia salina TaxID=2860336 RepID=A0ABX8WFU7_9HYPH|nr:glycosyltransferase family protein [Devosia salina]QYO77770.1 glycosyltransferase family protein [Devosia salina]